MALGHCGGRGPCRSGACCGRGVAGCTHVHEQCACARTRERTSVCVRARVCAWVCVCAHECVFACACVCTSVCTSAADLGRAPVVPNAQLVPRMEQIRDRGLVARVQPQDPEGGMLRIGRRSTPSTFAHPLASQAAQFRCKHRRLDASASVRSHRPWKASWQRKSRPVCVECMGVTRGGRAGGCVPRHGRRVAVLCAILRRSIAQYSAV